MAFLASVRVLKENENRLREIRKTTRPFGQEFSHRCLWTNCTRDTNHTTFYWKERKASPAVGWNLDTSSFFNVFVPNVQKNQPESRDPQTLLMIFPLASTSGCGSETLLNPRIWKLYCFEKQSQYDNQTTNKSSCLHRERERERARRKSRQGQRNYQPLVLSFRSGHQSVMIEHDKWHA